MAQLLDTFGFDSVDAHDGVSAMHFASDDGIDLIVADVRLPKLDGPMLLDITIEGAFGARPPPLPNVWLVSRPFTQETFALAIDRAFPTD